MISINRELVSSPINPTEYYLSDQFTRMVSRLLSGLFIVLLVIGSSCSGPKTPKLRIAVSANLQFAMSELATAFEAKSGVQCEMIVGSSGSLTAQIQQGAPFHLFLSADEHYPKHLEEASLTYSPHRIYGFGQLVLWSARFNDVTVLGDLARDKVKRIAIANPRHAPYGIAAMEALENSGLLPLLNEKIVYGESIAQTNQFITSGAADYGFTSKSVVLWQQLEETSYWIDVDQSLYTPIAQACVVLKSEPKFEKLATAFQDFLLSDDGQLILERFGYLRAND
jgi:molybdate transport system substrate-binding protein